MKLLLTALLCLLLAGCSATDDTLPTETAPPEVPDSLRAQYNSAAEAVFLPAENIQNLFRTGSGLLLVSEGTLFLLDDRFQTAASCVLDFMPEIFVSGGQITAFDRDSRQLILLDDALQEIRRLTLPSDLSGCPVTDGSKVYYCTDSGIYLWDLETGIRRRIRESAGKEQELVDLHCGGTVLQCRTGEEDLFLDASTGQLVQQLKAPARLNTTEGHYYCTYTSGSVENLIFGTYDGSPMGLFPGLIPFAGTFLPESHCAVTLTDSLLSCYDLETGLLRDTLTLHHSPKAIGEFAGFPVILITEQGRDYLLVWQPDEAPSSGESVTDSWFPADDPDHAGLSLCRDYAQKLTETYGIPVRIWKEAAAVAPWDYDLEPEYRYPVLLSQLQTLEACLSRYPETVLQQTASHFDSLTICLVQSIRGVAGEESLSTATGVQFLEGRDAYVVLAAGPYQEQALYHELFHGMETHIFGHSNALDRWNELNPAGFSYDLDHSTNAQRNSGVYLEAESRAFVDTYSMSFPKEDRARIFEYAMLPDCAHLFRSETMQRKLNALCDGIREAYRLEESGAAFPWEQYLQ